MARPPSAPNRSARRLGAGLMLAAALLAAPPVVRPALASEPAASADALFNEGLELMAARDYTSALYRFKRSFDLLPKHDAAMNAALCLKELGRYDEALEMSEMLLTRFSTSLTEPDRKAIGANVKYFLTKVGSIEILANDGARIIVDGRARGVSPLDGPIHVMPGERKVRIVKEGFEPFETTREVTAGGSALVNVALKLVSVRPTLPRRPEASVTAFGGYTLSPSLNSTAESSAAVSGSPSVSGFITGVRAGYGFPTGFALELSLGYLYVASSFKRLITVQDPSLGAMKPVYDLEDDLRIRGPFLGFGLSYRVEINPWLSFVARVAGGVLSARSQHWIKGGVRVGATSAEVRVEDQTHLPLSSQPGFIMPEIGLEGAWGHLHAGLLLGVVVLPSGGPTFGNRYLGVQPSCSPAAPGGVGCVPNEPIAEGDDKTSALFGSFWSAVPQLAVGYSF